MGACRWPFYLFGGTGKNTPIGVRLSSPATGVEDLYVCPRCLDEFQQLLIDMEAGDVDEEVLEERIWGEPS